MNRVARLILALLCSCPLSLMAVGDDHYGPIPSEFESQGGHSLGFGQGGSAANVGLNSVKTNPAMLATKKTYEVNGSYHWPLFGRSFYQAGAIDSQTSEVAAGIIFTSSQNRYQLAKLSNQLSQEEWQNQLYDSPVNSRATLALAKTFKNLALGVNISHVDYFRSSSENLTKKSSITTGLGVVALVTPSLRLGLSAENLGNKDVKEIAPVTYRLAAAAVFYGGQFTAHIDHIKRARVPWEQQNSVSLAFHLNGFVSSSDDFDLKDEQMTIVSTSALVYDFFRVLASYGYEWEGRQRRSYSGGLALVTDAYAFSYALSKPYNNIRHLHSSLTLSLQVAI